MDCQSCGVRSGNRATIRQVSPILLPLKSQRLGTGRAHTEGHICAHPGHLARGLVRNARRLRREGRQNGHLARDRAGGVRDDHRVIPRIGCLHIRHIHTRARRACEGCAVELPLIAQRGGAGRADRESRIAAHRHALALRLEDNPRGGAFSGRPRGVDTGDFTGRQRAVVKRHLVERPVELAVPIRLAGSSEEKREAAIVLREADVGVALQGSVNVKLDNICAAHGRDMIPNTRRNRRGRAHFDRLP